MWTGGCTCQPQGRSHLPAKGSVDRFLLRERRASRADEALGLATTTHQRGHSPESELSKITSCQIITFRVPVLTHSFLHRSFAVHINRNSRLWEVAQRVSFRTYRHFPLLIQTHIPSTSSLSRSTSSFHCARMATSVWSVMLLVTLASAQTTTVVVSSTDASPSCGACLFGTTGPCIHDTTGQCFPFVSGGSHCDRGLR